MTYTGEELNQALITIQSMIDRSVKVQPSLKEGSPQASLTINRIEALRISSVLISRALDLPTILIYYPKELLEKSTAPIISTIKKCEKVVLKLKEGSWQLKNTQDMIQALQISLDLINQEIAKMN